VNTHHTHYVNTHPYPSINIHIYTLSHPRTLTSSHTARTYNTYIHYWRERGIEGGREGGREGWSTSTLAHTHTLTRSLSRCLSLSLLQLAANDQQREVKLCRPPLPPLRMFCLSAAISEWLGAPACCRKYEGMQGNLRESKKKNLNGSVHLHAAGIIRKYEGI